MNYSFKLAISPRWKIHPVFHVSLLEHYQTSVRNEREQQPGEAGDIDSDLECEVERIDQSEVITYTRNLKLCGRNRRIRVLGILLNGNVAQKMTTLGNPQNVWITWRSL